MVRLISYLGLLGLAFVTGFAFKQYEPFPYHEIQRLKNELLHGQAHFDITYSPFYKAKVSVFDTMQTTDVDVVMLGASHVEFGPWSELFPDHKIANRGVSGDTTIGVLRRLDNILKLNPKTVFFVIGGNDFNSDKRAVADTADLYMETVDKLIDANLRVVMLSAPLWGQQYPVITQQLAELNAEIEKRSKQSKATYVDFNQALTDGTYLLDKYTYDGIHLNGPGYLIWADAMKPYMP